MFLFQGMITGAALADALPVIVSLILIEGLLSVDNALAIAAMASVLPPKERKLALRLGILGAYLFRGIALLVASWIIANPWVKVLGALYLVYLMCSQVGGEGHPGGKKTEATGKGRFWEIFFKIQVVDLSLSIDNVIAAIALSNKLWIVCTGVFIGILALRLVTGSALRLLEKYPILAPTAFVLVGYVGLLLLAEMAFHFDIGSAGKFVGIVLILGAALAYASFPRFHRVLEPVVKGSRRAMGGTAWLMELPFRPAAWLWRRAFAKPGLRKS